MVSFDPRPIDLPTDAAAWRPCSKLRWRFQPRSIRNPPPTGAPAIADTIRTQDGRPLRKQWNQTSCEKETCVTGNKRPSSVELTSLPCGGRRWLHIHVLTFALDGHFLVLARADNAHTPHQSGHASDRKRKTQGRHRNGRQRPCEERAARAGASPSRGTPNTSHARQDLSTTGDTPRKHCTLSQRIRATKSQVAPACKTDRPDDVRRRQAASARQRLMRSDVNKAEGSDRHDGAVPAAVAQKCCRTLCPCCGSAAAVGEGSISPVKRIKHRCPLITKSARMPRFAQGPLCVRAYGKRRAYKTLFSPRRCPKQRASRRHRTP